MTKYILESLGVALEAYTGQSLQQRDLNLQNFYKFSLLGNASFHFSEG